MEIYVYEKETMNLFVYNDFILSSFPVCLEWLETDFTVVEDNSVKRANIGIVGFMNSEIELWDLNEENPHTPFITLRDHQGAITCLKLHKERINLLLSGSEDK